MKMLDRKTAGDLTKLVIFIVVTTLATGVLVVIIGNLTFAGSKDYKAEFVDATGVVKGDDVRIAGVKVGVVKDVADRRPDPRDGHLLGAGRHVADEGHARRDPLPQPGRPALHLADPGGRATAPGSPRATPSRSPRPRRRST